MSISHLKDFSIIETVLSNLIPIFCVFLGTVELLFRVERVNEWFSNSASSDESQDQGEVKKNRAADSDSDSELSNQLPCSSEEKTEDGHMCREEVEVVMGKLGISCSPEGGKFQERLGSDDLSNLFEEKEPSLEEVKEAFNVFDEDRDGFIDAKELQSVLCGLGFKEGLEMQRCRSMIAAFDENGDGRIDFTEFVKFMESTF
ncbi:probable calcium-binding protein CML46 [Actinidia eriantha]|uniref:probable calcium-binding protein CML46 n=1 Tax=Actinidia eriantha TaxID=165200 RepID=UPI002584DB6B|nr:probable calcium-binding protein CML46 [Actinidia eriantha]